MIEALEYLWNTIEWAAGVINAVVSAFNLCLTCGVFIGQFIVDIFSRSCSNAYNVAASIVRAITIMYEDFPYFLSDLQNILFFVESIIGLLYESIFNTISSVYNASMDLMYLLLYTLVSVKDCVYGIYRNGLKTIHDCIYTFKGALILIGNVIWMSLTLIPGVFVYSFSLFVFFINKCAEEIVSIFCSIIDILNTFYDGVYHFITDTPFEAVCGLFIGCATLYFTNKHRIIILHLISQNICKFSKYIQEMLYELLIVIVCFIYFSFNKLKILLNNTKQTILHNYSRRILNVQNTLELPNNGNERLCVVCQDSETNIVIIPCKHMCLCEECSENALFTSYRGAMCPVCRCEINGILKVYL